MAAAIAFYSGDGVTALGSSGIGFYGSTFGQSVQVASYQDSTFITNSNGTINGGQLTNTKYVGTTSGVQINGGSTITFATVPTISGTMNVRFTYDTPVKTQNGEIRIFDRSDPDADPSGVTCQVNQIVNGFSGVNQSTGAADAANDGWFDLAGSGSTMVLLSSPGESGLSPSGVDTTDDRHDWYFALSASPDSIGSKTLFGAYIALEYL
jgi:hypothetical protein